MKKSVAIFGKFNTEPSAAERERLHRLFEELAESQKEIAKILQYGYVAHDDYTGISYDNRQKLAIELGQSLAAVGLMVKAGDLRREDIVRGFDEKAPVIGARMRHQPPKLLKSFYQKSEMALA